MGMQEALRLFFKNYVNFQGRSRRAEFWWPALVNLIVSWTLTGISILLGGGFEAYASFSLNTIGWVFYGLSTLWGLIVFLPNLSVTVRRLHDRDMSGWWLLGFTVGLIIPIVNLVVLIAYIVIMAMAGTVGPNKFGPDPKSGLDVGVFN